MADDTLARWTDGLQYVVQVAGEEYYSDDGDDWVTHDGRDATLPVAVTLCGGPRDGETVYGV